MEPPWDGKTRHWYATGLTTGKRSFRLPQSAAADELELELELDLESEELEEPESDDFEEEESDDLLSDEDDEEAESPPPASLEPDVGALGEPSSFFFVLKSVSYHPVPFN